MTRTRAATAPVGEPVQVLFDILAGFGLQDTWAIDAARALRSAIHGFTSLGSDGGFGLPRSIDRS